MVTLFLMLTQYMLLKINKFIDEVINSSIEDGHSDKSYYVYLHTFKNGHIYVGKGCGARYLETKSGRSQNYTDFINLFGEPDKKILVNKITEDQAYKIESEVIILHREHNLPLVNITDGFENLNIGDMPWRTLVSLVHDDEGLDDIYKQVIHLRKKTDSRETYLVGFSVFSAAKKVRCSCNDILKLMKEET